MAKESLSVKELQDRLESLENRFDEMIQGFRGLSAKIGQVSQFFQDAKTQLEAVKVDVANIKQNNINNQNYGSKVTRF